MITIPLFPSIACVLATVLLFSTNVSAEPSEDGLHKQPWFETTFNDIPEDIAEAYADGKRLVIFIEQRGCIYCAKLHSEVLSDPEVAELFKEHSLAVQFNVHGDEQLSDTDGQQLSEKEAMRKWRIGYTPTILFMPKHIAEDESKHTAQLAVASLQGKIDKETVIQLFDKLSQQAEKLP